MDSLFLLVFGLIVGFLVGRKRSESDIQALVHAEQADTTSRIMLGELEKESVARILGPDIQQQLRQLYRPAVVSSIATAPPAAAPTRPSPHPARKTTTPPVFVGPPVPAGIARPHPARASQRALRRIRPSRPRVRREPVHLDPALVLLYLGAFLIVAAGLIYASFNWEELQGIQKLGLLAAATAGFIVAGLALLRSARLRPAAETFIGIGALLIPSNIIAAVTVLSDTPIRATLALQIGAVLATLLYTVFAFRPGTSVYRYAAMISACVAIGVVPASLGAHRAWALPALALAPALLLATIDRLGQRAERFWHPALRVALSMPPVAFLAITITGMPPAQDTIILASLLGATAVTLGVVAAIYRQAMLALAAIFGALGAVMLANTWIELGAVRMVLASTAGVSLLLLALRGPRFYRTTMAASVTFASVLAFGLNVMGPYQQADADGALTWVVVVTPALIAAGWSLVAITQRWTWLMLPAIMLAYLSHGLALDRLGWLAHDEPALLFGLLPGTIVAAALPALTCHWSRLTSHRSHSFFLWIGYGAISIALAGIAYGDMDVNGVQGTRLVAVTYCLLFAVAAMVAAQQHRQFTAMVISASWLVVGVVLALDALPVPEAYRWPVFAAGCAALALAVPLIAGGIWWRRFENLQWVLLIFTVAAATAAAPMVASAAGYITHSLTRHDHDLMPGYPMILAGTTLVFGLYARYRFPRVTTGIAAVSGMLAAGMVLRWAFDRSDPDVLVWPAVGIMLGLPIAIVAERMGRMEPLLARLWAGWSAFFAGLILIVSLAWAVPQTLMYVAAAWSEGTVPHGDAPIWWVPYLLAFTALALTGHWIAMQRPEPIRSATVSVSGMSVIFATGVVLSIGMERFDPDPRIWTAIGIVLGALVGVGALRIGDLRSVVATHWSSWIGVLASLLALPSLAWAAPDVATYIAAGWLEVDTPHDDDIRGWLPLMAAFAVTAVIVHFGTRSRPGYIRDIGIGVAAVSAMLTTSMVLSTGMHRLDPDPLIWPAVGIALGLAIRIGAAWLQNRHMVAATRWSWWAAGYAGIILLVALGRALPETTLYIASAWRDVSALHQGAPVWWLPLLGGYVAITLTAHWMGWLRDVAAYSAITAASGLVAIALATRMLTTDVFTWTVVGMLVGGAAAASAVTITRYWPHRAYVRRWALLARGLQFVGIVALVGNIVAGVMGEIDPWRNVALYGVLSIAAAIGAVRLRRPEILYGSTSALGLVVLFILMSPQVDALDGLMIPAGIAWLLVTASLAPRLSHRWSQPLEYSGYAFGLAPIIYPMVRTELAWTLDSTVYQRVTLAIMSLGLVLGLAALVRRSPVRGTVAVALVLVAAIRQVATYEPASWQPYAVVLAIAMAATGVLWHRWHSISDPLYALAGTILVGVPFIESFTIGGTQDAFIAGAYAILVVVLGLVARRQEPVAVGVIGVTLVVMRQLVDTAMAFESWQVLGTAGAILVIGGTIILAIRDTLHHWFDSGMHFWHSLG